MQLGSNSDIGRKRDGDINSQQDVFPVQVLSITAVRSYLLIINKGQWVALPCRQWLWTLIWLWASVAPDCLIVVVI